MKKYLLLLGADQYLRERALAGARQVYDGEVWTTSLDPISNPNRYFDGQLFVKSMKADDILKSINLMKERGWYPSAVVPLNDWTLEAASVINESLGLAGVYSDVARLARDKIKMKKVLIDAGVKTAKFAVITTEEELCDALDTIPFPVVIKPSEFGGSGGVSLAKDKNEAIKAFNHSREIMNEYAEEFRVDGSKFIVEEFIDSDDEVSVEVICDKDDYQILSVTEKYLSPRPYFEEMAHLVPSHRFFDEDIRKTAINACSALGIHAGMAHVEIKVSLKGNYVIELAARPGGDGIMDQVERAFGVNPYSRHILSYLGKRSILDEDPKPIKTSSIAFLKAPIGVISKVKKIPFEELPEGLIRLEIKAKVGEYSEEPICWRSREGIVEYEWNELFDHKTSKPVELTKKLSSMIFEVEDK